MFQDAAEYGIELDDAEAERIAKQKVNEWRLDDFGHGTPTDSAQPVEQTFDDGLATAEAQVERADEHERVMLVDQERHNNDLGIGGGSREIDSEAGPEPAPWTEADEQASIAKAPDPPESFARSMAPNPGPEQEVEPNTPKGTTRHSVDSSEPLARSADAIEVIERCQQTRADEQSRVEQLGRWHGADQAAAATNTREADQTLAPEVTTPVDI